MEQGATHYTHWFQTLNGATAEKHDAFLSIDKDGKAIELFKVKCLFSRSPMHRVSQVVESETLSRLAVIRLGIHRRLRLY
jgi:hypothetical protein